MNDIELELVVGDRFTMKADTKPVEIRNPDGSLLVRFLPGYGYRVTGKNLETANKMLADGACVKGGAPLGERLAAAGFSALRGDVAGAVSVKPKGKRKTKSTT